MSELIGQKFNRWEVIDFAELKWGTIRHWKCRCFCGRIRNVSEYKLKTNKSRSCGCSSRSKYLHLGIKSQKDYPREYYIWCGMKARCRSKDPRYGGRGISFEPSWESFETFYKDMGSRPSPQHSLERLDNNGNYGPKNCKWATVEEQVRNKRNSRLISAGGETRTLSEWAVLLKTVAGSISCRIDRQGWSPEKAVLTPIRMQKNRHSATKVGESASNK